MSRCLRNQSPFGVVCIQQGREVRSDADASASFESIGVLAQVLDVDAEGPGILKVRCQGGQRIQVGQPRQLADGLWVAPADLLDADDVTAVPTELSPCAQALGHAIESLAEQDQHPFIQPHRLHDAGWVANRWCEILPISLAAKQKLMALDAPAIRLKLVDDYLRGKGVL